MSTSSSSSSPAVRLEHANSSLARVTVVDWTLGNACNYACSYCPASLHDGSAKWIDARRVVAFGRRAIAHYAGLGRAVLFQFSGGEPTVHPEFLRIVAALREAGARVGVISNASRTLRWWGEARPHLSQAVLTHHVEFVDLAHFSDVARHLSREIRTHVNVTMLPARFDECLASARQIASACADVTVTLKPLLVGFGSETYPYSAAQRAAMGERIATRLTRPLAESRGPMRVTCADGRSVVRKAAELIVAGENRFGGWACEIGVELLAVDARGWVYRGLCRQGGRVGHVGDERIDLPRDGVVCERPTCHCATDLMTSRRKS